jgi:flavin-binding protein dodecin
MAGQNARNVSLPSIDDLQLWANDQELARSQLKAIFAALESGQEEFVNWATEALENMGPPLATDMNWLGSIASSQSADAVYWAITLLGRSEESIDSVQDALAKAIVNSQSTVAIRRRAISALAKVHIKSKATELAIQSALKSDDSQLVSAAREIFQPV